MSFNIFGPATKKDIRVGYIDPDLGYVQNVSILEANKYAALNPGTMFILKNRDATRYLTLNEVNALTPDVLDVDGNVCDGVKGLRPGERAPFPITGGNGSGGGGNGSGGGGNGSGGGGNGSGGGGNGSGGGVNNSYDEGCRGRLFLSGGGGVGAVGSPIFGRDGSLLAIRVVSGGFGYKYPPKAKLIDSCKRGSGAVIRTIIGELPPTTEYFDQEEDFEIYDLTPDGTELSGYGLRYGVDGDVLGNWDPNLFATLATDPIQLEINKYQDFLKKGINPFWHTRKENPISVTFRDKTTRVLHEVAHWAWGGKEVTAQKSPPSEEEFFEDVKFKVFRQGGKKADNGLVFNFAAEDGSHKFKFTANSFKDSKTDTVTKKVKRNTVYKITSTGSFRGKGTEQGLIGGLGRDAKEIKGNKKGSVIFADFVESSNDNDDLQVEATQGKFTASNERKQNGHSTNDLTYIFESTKDFKPKPKPKTSRKIEDSFMNRYAVSPVPASNAPGSDFAGQIATLEWEEDFPYTGEYVFRGMADNVATLYLDNEELIKTRKFRGDPTDTIKKTIEEGVHRIKVDLLNIPIKEKVKPQKPQDLTITYHGLNQGSTKTVRNEKKYPIRLASPGTKGRGEFAVIGNVEDKKIRYLDEDGDDPNATLKIKSTSPGVSAKFSGDGSELIVKGNGDVTLEFKWDDDPKKFGMAVGELKIGSGEKVSATFRQIGENGKEEKTIKVGAQDSKQVIGKGGFKVSGDKKEVKMKDGHGDDINSTFSIASSTNNARFSDDGKKLITDGPGNVKLRLKWDDDPKTAGVAVDKITVGGVVLDQRGEKGSNTKTLVVKGSPNPSKSSQTSQVTGTIFTTTDYIGKADRKLWRTNVYGRGGFLNEYGVCPFNTRKSLDDNPYAGRHVIRWESIDFPADGNYNITVDADDFVKIFIGNRDGAGKMAIGNGLGDIEQGGDEVIIENGMKKTTHTKFFKKGKYRIRTELTQIPGGRFSFDGDGKPKSNRITARFVNRDGKNYLKVDGSGTAEIGFKLKVDDNPRTSGVFASKVKIGLPPNDYVLLSRSRSGNGYKERETITGSDIFEAGREYLIDTIGSSRRTGSRIRNNGKDLQYDDNIDNGFDRNGELTITKIKNQQPSSIKGVNPMALAIKIDVGEIEQSRISPRTWYQNPMGAAFTIDSPLPPIPESPIPVGEGRCPKNPIWTTRFPNAQKKWWPVNHPAWSKFTNRFALSPLPPLNTPNSDGGGGIVYENTWPLEIPYDGFYGIKGTADNKGRILIDGQEVYRLKGFKNSSPKIKKVKLIEGKHTITVEVENFRQENAKIIKKKIFSTQDWAGKQIKNPAEPAEQCESVIIYNGLHPRNKKLKVSSDKKRIDFIDGDGNDTNASFRIKSGDAVFSNDGKKLIGEKAKLEFEYDDDPSNAGVAIDSISIGKITWAKKQKSGSKYKTAREAYEAGDIRGLSDFSKDIITETRWRYNKDLLVAPGLYRQSKGVFALGKADGFNDPERSIWQVDKDDDEQGFVPLGRPNLDESGKVSKSINICAESGKEFKSAKPSSISIQAAPTQKGVIYSGPDIFRYIDTRKTVWSDFMNKNNVSPFLPPLNSDNPDIVGERTFTWSNVDFPENGSYELEFQADDTATLFINGQQVAVSKSFRGVPIKSLVDLSRGKYELKVVLTNIQLPKDIFANYNPTGFALKIIKDIKKVISTPPWTSNPLCASAIMIPPPCPKIIEGTGVVTEIIPEEPGNGYPTPPGGGPPVTLVLKEIVPTSPGINYGPEDSVLINGKPLKPVLGPFGTVEAVIVPDTPSTGTPLYGFTEYPNITMPSDTGVGFRGRPVFEPVIVPELVLPEDQLLQVTDLVGLKQTGYVNGKPYYGSTFSQDGILYAGVYETTGDLVQVYATLQESVDGEVTTRASAILRQGSDVTSNDPRLNIPNTPDNLV